MSQGIKLTEQSYLDLLNKILKNKEEERDLALDRYRKVDESMESNEHFVVMGKNAVAFLRLASDNTNDLMNLSKDIKSIIFKDAEKGLMGPGNAVNDDMMKKMIDSIESEKKSQPNDNLPESNIDSEDNN
jgi:hypothetical protein